MVDPTATSEMVDVVEVSYRIVEVRPRLRRDRARPRAREPGSRCPLAFAIKVPLLEQCNMPAPTAATT